MEVETDYRIFKISKGRGLFRTIYEPGERFKGELKSYLPYLTQKNIELDKHKACHAFVKGRNCATNALQHIGYEHSVSLDLRDFFDSIKPDHVDGKILNRVISRCFVDGAPRQGLPTSPLIANIALVDCDNKIIAAMEQLSGNFAYTRYADDICISVDDKKAIPKAKYIVTTVLKDSGLELNVKKTRVQHQSNGRRIITGIGVDKQGLHPTRKTIKNLRAATHQNNKDSIDGLVEWANCKLPGQSIKKKRKTHTPFVNPSYVTCKYCGEDGLKWNIEDGRRFILVSSFNRQKHICGSLPAPISLNEVKCRLMEAGFKEFQPQGKTWATGYFSSRHDHSLFVLLRKNGVDLGFHDYPHTLVEDDTGSVCIRGLITERHTYGNSIGNVHFKVCNAVDSLQHGFGKCVPSSSFDEEDIF